MAGNSISTPNTPLPLRFSAPYLLPQAESIAQRWGFQLAGEAERNDAEFFLLLTDNHLALCQSGDDVPGPVYVDFVSGAVAHRRKFGGGKGQPIAKTAGFGKGEPPSIIDATAGLGRDSFVFASLGSRFQTPAASTRRTLARLQRRRQLLHCFGTLFPKSHRTPDVRERGR